MMAFRRLSSATDSSATDLGDNDDEAEKEERRSRVSSGSSKSSNSTASFISNLSPVEIEVQIAQCLKLNAENKINDKNAFQLKMIDFLVYGLKKHDPKISNLQMASAYLDASGKIYGYRVDKVHSDLLKIVGGARGEKRPHEDDEEDLGEAGARPKKRRKKKHNFISTNESLKGHLESYNPLVLLQTNLDITTSDHLILSSSPQHTNQGTLLNFFKDVLLDKIPSNNRYSNYSNFIVPRIEDFLENQLCPSYGDFQFLGWSVNNEPMDTSESEPSNSDYHFDMDIPIEDEQKSNGIMDYRDEDERFHRAADQEPLVDFQEIISNNPNPDATYEYSYLQGDFSIQIVKPSHWKVHIKRDVRYAGLTGPVKKARRKKAIELEFADETKEEADTRFVINKIKRTKLLRATYSNWSDNNLLLPEFREFQMNRFSSYFEKNTIAGELDGFGKVESKVEEERASENADNLFNLSGFGDEHHNQPLHLQFDERDKQIADDSFNFPDSEPPSQPPLHEPFLGENLVTLPTLTEKVFIPYSQRAKKVDMRQLKKSIQKVLHNQESVEFSQLYTTLPVLLNRNNAQSLSPGLAFTSLLQVAHENKLQLINHANYADLTISNGEKDRE